jgi:transcriptional regulator with XRE-family HTH domain
MAHDHRSGPGTDLEVEQRVRHRIRALRTARGWSLDELARRTLIGASTLSRIETGSRRIALDQLAPIARALHTSIDDLLASEDEDDVVIRPVRDVVGGSTVWALSRPDEGSGRSVTKMRIPARKTSELKVHPGREWFYVLSGTIRLHLEDRVLLVEEGNAAEFSTMTPHAISGHQRAAEIIGIFDRDGERAHLIH